jgi:hypothetical protein
MKLIIYLLIGIVIISIVIYSRKPRENEQKLSAIPKKDNIKTNNSNVVELQAKLAVQIVDNEKEYKNVQDDNLQVELASFDMEKDDYSNEQEYIKYMREGISTDVSDESLKTLIDLVVSGSTYQESRDKIREILPANFYYRFYDVDKDITFKDLEYALNVMKGIKKPNRVSGWYSGSSFYYFDSEKDINERYFTRVETSREHYKSYMLTLNLNEMKKILPFKVRKKDDYVDGILERVDIGIIIEKLNIPKMITVETTEEYDKLSKSIAGYNDLITTNLHMMYRTLYSKHCSYRDYRDMNEVSEFFPKIGIDAEQEYCCENCKRKLKVISAKEIKLKDLPPYRDCISEEHDCSVYAKSKMEDE